MPNAVEYKGRTVNVGTIPIGIDPEKFTEVTSFWIHWHQALQEPKCKARIAELEQKFKGKHIIVGVDRLDYIKGVPQKLHAFEVFLSQHPEWVGEVILPFISNL
jgi:trehalose 6-phosphate synthase